MAYDNIKTNLRTLSQREFFNAFNKQLALTIYFSLKKRLQLAFYKILV